MSNAISFSDFRTYEKPLPYSSILPTLRSQKTGVKCSLKLPFKQECLAGQLQGVFGKESPSFRLLHSISIDHLVGVGWAALLIYQVLVCRESYRNYDEVEKDNFSSLEIKRISFAAKKRFAMDATSLGGTAAAGLHWMFEKYSFLNSLIPLLRTLSYGSTLIVAGISAVDSLDDIHSQAFNATAGGATKEQKLAAWKHCQVAIVRLIAKTMAVAWAALGITSVIVGGVLLPKLGIFLLLASLGLDILSIGLKNPDLTPKMAARNFHF
ncbi:MAG: hypothetical protein ACM3JI_05560 [Anaerolineae bacterium]